MLGYNSYVMGDISNSNAVLAAVLRRHRFYRGSFPEGCDACMTAEQFTQEFPEGTYVLGFGNHVATVVNGVLYDSWDSSKEIPLYFFYRKEDN